MLSLAEKENIEEANPHQTSPTALSQCLVLVIFVGDTHYTLHLADTQ